MKSVPRTPQVFTVYYILRLIAIIYEDFFMKLQVLGKFGPFAPYGGATSGYLLSCDVGALALDMGSGVFSRLLKEYPPEEILAVIISHFHYDHIADLGVFNYYLESLSKKGLLKNKINLYMPKEICSESESIKNMSYFNVTEVSDGDVVDINGLTVKFFKSAHPVYCLGMVICDGSKKFLYSSDGDVSTALTDNMKDCSYALLHGAFLSENYKKGGAHMSISACGELSEQFGVKCVVSHSLPFREEKAARNEVEKYSLCELAEEFKVYNF